MWWMQVDDRRGPQTVSQEVRIRRRGDEIYVRQGNNCVTIDIKEGVTILERRCIYDVSRETIVQGRGGKARVVENQVLYV